MTGAGGFFVSYIDVDGDDEELVAQATRLLESKFALGRHHVAAAGRTADGQVVVGLHIGSRRVNVCAEQVALGAALTAGLGPFVACASVIKMTADEAATVTSPCGVCREVLTYYNSAMTTLVRDGQGVHKTRISDLLPVGWVLPHEIDDPPTQETTKE